MIQTYTIRELAQKENVQVMTIRYRIDKKIYLPVIFRKGRKDRTRTTRYLSAEISAILVNNPNLLPICRVDNNEVEILEQNRNS